jgi:hypothetical protein
MTMKHLIANTSLVIASVLIALLIGEGALRFAGTGETEISDPVLGTRTTGRLGWDANGWKNNAILSQADIVAIGDSQTEGNNATVDDAWPQTLGRIATTSVYQMAMGGYSPVQYGALFDDAIKKNPKTVIVGFYFGNDLHEAYRIAYKLPYWSHLRDPNFVEKIASGVDEVDYRTVLSTGLRPDSFMYKVHRVRLWVRAHSVFYATMGNATRTLREKIGVAKEKQEKIDDVAAFAAEHPDIAYYEHTLGIETVLSPAYRLDTVSFEYPETKEGWRISVDRFLSMKEKAVKNNIRLIVVVIPTKEGVYLEHWRRIGKEMPSAFFEYEKRESILAETTRSFCISATIECVFALPKMADALDRGEQIYGKTMDGHPIAAGYRTIAETLAEYLASNK